MLPEIYEDVFNFSISNTEGFWGDIAKELEWIRPFKSVIDNEFSHSPKWFSEGEINMSYNCLDRNVKDGYGDEVAIIHDSPITGTTRKYTYNQLLDSVSLLAGVMADRCGIKKGDMVLLYFPVIPECVISMLACTRLGAPYIVIYGGFSSKELGNRINYIKPKLILTCNVGSDYGPLQNYKEKLDIALGNIEYSPNRCLVLNRTLFKPAPMRETIDLDWATELFKAKPHDPVPVASDHPMYFIFSSGTTGDPKCFVHLTGSCVVYDHYLGRYIFDFKPKETTWILSNFGWVNGQSVMTYSIFLTKGKTIVFEGKLAGGTDNGQFARVLNWHKVSQVGSAPRIMRVIQHFCSKSDLELNYQGLKYIGTGAEVCEQKLRNWIGETFKCNVHQSYGQTETNGVIAQSITGFKLKDDATPNLNFMTQPPGLQYKVVDSITGLECPRGEPGRVLIKMPFILANTIYQNEEKFRKLYFERFPGYYDTLDTGIMREDGTFAIVGREDDIITIGAARICATALEEACVQNEDISEAIAVSLDDNFLGTTPFIFLIRKPNANKSDQDVIDDTIKIVKDVIGDAAHFNRSVMVSEYPRTIVHKVHRSSLTAMINGRDYKTPTLVVNEQVYPIIHDILVKAGYKATLPN